MENYMGDGAEVIVEYENDDFDDQLNDAHKGDNDLNEMHDIERNKQYDNDLTNL
jgi:hypothetical protein